MPVTPRQRESGNRYWLNRPFDIQPPTPVVRRAVNTSPSPTTGANTLDTRPTPDPTGDPSSSTIVHINSESDFSLILPNQPGGFEELIGEAEVDGVAYCSPHTDSPGCDGNMFSNSFIMAATYSESNDGAWIQVTGCMDPSKFHLDPNDAGGQFDVRYPNGAQCTFGGYGASFIELVEPALGRFCIRCCASANDQINCNSHQDRMGCITAIPGTYDFPDLGVSCS
ncbi:hypothetical protein H0H87_011363 [Tephrocybe sp. NHM501043]|nr:hypothetical protein H0H87_011363 [Tephrocybe sp. NHM501043]